jgi:hypothetical protein
VASHLYEHAVILLLEDARPVILTPSQPEDVVAMIRSLQTAAEKQAVLAAMRSADTGGT